MRLLDLTESTANPNKGRFTPRNNSNIDTLALASRGYDHFCVQFIDDDEPAFDETLAKLQSMNLDVVTRVSEIKEDGLFETSYCMTFKGRDNLLSTLSGRKEYFAVYVANEEGKLQCLEPIYQNSKLIRTLCF